MPRSDPGAVTPLHVRKSGRFYRVADRDWPDALNTSYAQSGGGRWNPPESFGVLYLNEDVQTARGYVRHKHAGLPYGPEDLLRPPILVTVVVREDDFVDAGTDGGLQALGLQACYPRTAPGSDDIVPHSVCQPIGKELFDADEPGIACRSATTPAGDGSELAWFEQPGRETPREQNRHAFDEWYWRGRSS